MKDQIRRTMDDSGSFRVIAARTTDLVGEIVKRQGVSGQDAENFADLLTAAAILRETMAPSERMQVILSREGVGQIVADSHPPSPDQGARIKGVFHREAAAGNATLWAEDTTLKVIRSMPKGQLHQSIIQVGGRGVAEAMMAYLQESEQIAATLILGTVVDGAEVKTSGGFIVQLLPEVDANLLGVMAERLDHDFKDFAHFLLNGDDPARITEEVLYRMPFTILATGDLTGECDCSQERVLTALATLGRKEIQTMVDEGEVIQLTCEYCKREFHVGSQTLRTLLDKPS